LTAAAAFLKLISALHKTSLQRTYLLTLGIYTTVDTKK